jgi:hypothetical protein
MDLYLQLADSQSMPTVSNQSIVYIECSFLVGRLFFGRYEHETRTPKFLWTQGMMMFYGIYFP